LIRFNQFLFIFWEILFVNFVIQKFFLFLRANFLGMYQQEQKYKIPVQRMAEGVHTIQLEIQKEFIEQQKIEEMQDMQVQVVVEFTKRLQLHTMVISLHGWVQVPCDRCLESLQVQISNTSSFVVKQSTSHEELSESEDVIFYSHDQTELDISHILYEIIMVSMPLKKVHDDKVCNSSITSYITKQSKEQTIDPRWESLKNIFKN